MQPLPRGLLCGHPARRTPPQATETSEPLGESPAELAYIAALLVPGVPLTPQLLDDLSTVGAGKTARLMERLIGGS
ncbi:hypothetical protein [Streptomyces sp. NPDC058441]|uniref:hypothetical protein n=1 Tax=Streptomyces sp. NPDC058441 TaxID=3346502 RepID=UPI003656BC9B